MASIGIRILLITPEKEMIPFSLKLDFQCTHNMAEYEALIQGLRILQDFNVKRVHAFGDSLLVISQVKAEWQVKDQKLLPYQKIVLALIDGFDEFQLFHIKREFNQIADGLASLGSIMSFRDEESCRSFEIGRLDQPAFIPVMQINQTEQKKKPWYQDIKISSKLWASTRIVKEGAESDSTYVCPIFYSCRCPLSSCGFSAEYSRCLDKEEAKEVVREAHEGICGGHVGYQTLVKQIIRAGYYWKTMQQDCYHFVKKCVQCQMHAPSIHAPATYLQSVVSPWPFSMWAFDVVGPITPSASNGHKYFLAATEYFTKWVEAVTLRTVEGQHVVSFIHKNILCHFGIPHDIVSDNGTHFKNERMKIFCSKFRIHHHFQLPTIPKGTVRQKLQIKFWFASWKEHWDGSWLAWENPWCTLGTIEPPFKPQLMQLLQKLVYETEVVLPLYVQKPLLSSHLY